MTSEVKVNDIAATIDRHISFGEHGITIDSKAAAAEIYSRLTAQSGEGRSGAGEDALARFGHHPDPATDFCIEVTELECIVTDKELGLRDDEEIPLSRIARAMSFRVGGDEIAVGAKQHLREIEDRAAALNARQSGEGERNSAIEDIAAERQRQIETEGWTPEHDDVHADGGELSRAAACYAAHASAFQRVTVDLTAYRTADPARHDYGWPWSSSWWKPSTPRRDLVKAGALIVAEIERLDRAALRATDDAGGA